jgi:diguanylate cyclase (GGDEF)-like protein
VAGLTEVIPPGDAGVEHRALPADRRDVNDGQRQRRRAEDVPAGILRRLASALSRGLYRTLAEDDDRAAYWVNHVRHGVVLTELSGIAALVYILLAPGQGDVHPLLLAIAGSAIVAAPLLLLLPMAEWTRDRRGPLFFYAWSITVTLMVSIAARIDGGAASPLYALLFITLGYSAAAYPPYGVAAMGSFMTASHVLIVSLADLTSPAVFVAVVMAIYTALCVMTSTNSWAAYDRQVLLIRTQKLLAATDELTGSPNRRAFLDRLGAAIADVARARPAAVCLVDLDGFKQVNDRDGHLAGDGVLKDVALALAGAVRETDTVARLGGDEFAVLARTSPDLSGEVLAERLRAAVAVVGADRGVTASVGVATLSAGDDLEAVLHRADEAMYRAKSSGGDRVDASGTAPVVRF